MEDGATDALGIVGEPHLWTVRDLLGNMDMVALAGLSRYAAGYESGSRSPFSGGHQSVDRARLAIHAAANRVSRMAFLCCRGFWRKESVVDRNARRRTVPATGQLHAAAGPTEKRCR